MQVCEHDLAREHCALMRDYGRVQLRCSDQMGAQAREIERLQAENLRLRARLLARETALAWAVQDHVTGEQAVWSKGDAQALERILQAADWVICQTGCLGHGAFWRVQEHCRRTAKTCVLVAQPDLLRLVRGQNPDAGARAPHEPTASTTVATPACSRCSADDRAD